MARLLYPMNPLTLSIITPCLNRARFITEAVESAQHQNHSHVEHIIMDGGSTDGTLEVLTRYPHLRVYSQPDKGIYDALNKGIRLASGEVVAFLNTDDLYEPDIFEAVAQTFIMDPKIDALVGGASIFTEEAPGSRVTVATFPCTKQKELLARATVGSPIFNAWFFRKRLFAELGEFDLRYLYIADRDFLIRMAFQNRPYASLDRPFYHYRMHPGSYTLSGQDSGEAGYMFECRALAERFLRVKGIGAEERNYFRSWHGDIIMEQITTAVNKRAYHRAIAYLLIGLQNNIGFSQKFVHKVIARLSALFRKRDQPKSSESR